MELILTILAYLSAVTFVSSCIVLSYSRRARDSKIYCKILLYSLIISFGVSVLSFLSLLILNFL